MTIIMRGFLILFVTVITSGCASSPALKMPKNQYESMIFGYINIQNAPGRFSGAVMKQVSPIEDDPYHISYIVNNNIFFLRQGVQPGVFKMDNFRTVSGFQESIVNVFDFPKSGRGELDVQVTKPGLHYLGAWKYKKVPVGVLKSMVGKGKFEMERLNSPTELEVLNRLLPYAKDKYWTDMINARIRQLRQ